MRCLSILQSYWFEIDISFPSQEAWLWIQEEKYGFTFPTTAAANLLHNFRYLHRLKQLVAIKKLKEKF